MLLVVMLSETFIINGSRLMYRIFKTKHSAVTHRSDGTVGTANYWIFLPTVFCENRNLDVIREALHNELGYAVTSKYKSFTKHLVSSFEEGHLTSPETLSSVPEKKRLFPNVDGIKFLTHQGGCGSTRQDANVLSNLLAAYVNHPNVGGITVLSLGCQHLQVQQLKEDILKQKPIL